MNQGKNSQKLRPGGFHLLAEQTSRLVEPILRKKTGLTLELFNHWPEIVGANLAEISLPLKIIWPRQRGQNAPLKPATLVIACEGFACLKIQHDSVQIIQRLNATFGFFAIEKIKIEQRQIVKPVPVSFERSLTVRERAWLEQETSQIGNATLRAGLARLGAAIITRHHNS